MLGNLHGQFLGEPGGGDTSTLTRLAMWYKVLQRGTFQFPDLQKFSSAGLEIDASTLRMILDGIDLSSIRRRERYRAPEKSIDMQHAAPMH